MDEDGVPSIHSPEVVTSDDLVYHEEDSFEEGHDQELSGGRYAQHNPEGDEDRGGGEVSRDESPNIDINVWPAAITLVRAKINRRWNSILTNLVKV